MKHSVHAFALALASLLLLPLAASATSISGVLIYSTQDETGTPVCWDWQQEVVTTNGQLWRTLAHPHWYGLGVLPGLPVESLRPELLYNAPDFSVAIPLIEGENDFTILGEGGPQSGSDSYERFALNLFFDGINDRPGISVLFRPRVNIMQGVSPEPNHSEITLSLGVSPRLIPADSVYDDGFFKVSVLSVSFGPPTLWSVDMVGSQTVGSGGDSDWGGIVKLLVEPSAQPGGQPVRGPGARGFGIIPGGVAGGGAVPGADISTGSAGPRVVGDPTLRGDRGMPYHEEGHIGADGGDVPMDAETPEPTAAPEETLTPGGTATPAQTSTPHATSGTASPTAATDVTPTPAPTSPAATTTQPASTPTTAAPVTPTAARPPAK